MIRLFCFAGAGYFDDEVVSEAVSDDSC